MGVNKKWVQINITRGVFITQTNICDRAFLRKQFTAFSCSFFFSQKESIIDVQIGSKYASE